jgi:hypothetical protein
MNWTVQLFAQNNPSPLAELPVEEGQHRVEADGVALNVLVFREKDGLRVCATASADSPHEVMLSLHSEALPNSTLWCFDGPVEKSEIYRQSPHDVDAWVIKGIARQSVPLVAVHDGNDFHVALNGSAALYANACSQRFEPGLGTVALRSGDDGTTPGRQPRPEDVAEFEGLGFEGQRFSPGRVIEYYHQIDSERSHTFEALVFSVEGDSLGQLRDAAYHAVAHVFSPGPTSGRFGDLAFVTAWMNLRRNDSEKSAYWVVPAAEYSNIQYNRDAFWIASMLDPEMDRECLLNELAEIDPQAEYPLFTLIWSQRILDAGGDLPTDRLQACLDVILEKARDNWYHAFHSRDGRNDFQFWQDSMAFAKEDVVTYNQGLYALALNIAKHQGLNLGSASADEAVENYQRLFDSERGYFSVSKEKTHLLTPDSLLPDLLAQVYLGEALLGTDAVCSHIDTLNRVALTPYGYKVLSRENGDYPTEEDTTIPGYTSESQRAGIQAGDYQRGGSWFLYDCLCLLDGVLHQVPATAQLLVWRIRLEMDPYGTTYEYLRTTDGHPHKSNMGWNVAIYYFLRRLTDENRISSEILKQIES